MASVGRLVRRLVGRSGGGTCRELSEAAASPGAGARAEPQKGPALFVSFAFFFLFVGGFCFGLSFSSSFFLILVSLRRNFYWGKEPMAALPQGGGLPMNVRLKSPAKGSRPKCWPRPYLQKGQAL